MRIRTLLGSVYWLLPLFLAAARFHAGAQQPPQACAAASAISVPEQDRPTLDDVRAAGVVILEYTPTPPSEGATRIRQTYCNGESLYYSADPSRFQHARSCVLAKLGLFRAGTPSDQARAAQSAAAGGATFPAGIDREGLVLAMVYANGEGVRKNLPLARRFLCEYGDGIGSDTNAEELTKFDALTSSGQRFDMCGKQIDFGRGVDYDCLGFQQDRRDKEVQLREAAILKTTSPPVRAAFVELRRAWEAFHSAYGAMDSAICDGGTGCGPITENDDLKFTGSWLAALKNIEAGTPPATHADAAKFSMLDRDLNEKFRASLKFYTEGTSAEEGLTPAVREADRKWLIYREAWVHFGALRWPDLPSDQWRAWQTLEWVPYVSVR